MQTPPSEVLMWIRRFFNAYQVDIPQAYHTYSNNFSVWNLLDILVLCLSVSVGLAFMWWGVRKLVGGLLRAFKHGRIHF